MATGSKDVARDGNWFKGGGKRWQLVQRRWQEMAGGRLAENNLRSKRFHRILATSVALSRYNKTRLNTKFTKDQFENCRRIGATESQPRAQEVQDLICVTHKLFRRKLEVRN